MKKQRIRCTLCGGEQHQCPTPEEIQQAAIREREKRPESLQERVEETTRTQFHVPEYYAYRVGGKTIARTL